jgi:hypothetical protein
MGMQVPCCLHTQISPQGLIWSNQKGAWDYFQKILNSGFSNVSICTDYPDKMLREICNEV